jgi:hypothetical protein
MDKLGVLDYLLLLVLVVVVVVVVQVRLVKGVYLEGLEMVAMESPLL